MTKETIIAYRNPLEQWFWESGAAPYFYGVLALVIIAVIIYTIWKEK